MKFTNVVLAASAASLVCAYPKGREVIPSKRNVDVKKRSSGFTWVGVSESGAEFGSNIPGTLGTDYTWPETSQIEILRNKGMNMFRVPFLMERLTQGSITATPDATYLAALKKTVNFITDSGAYAVLDPHNYGRFGGSIIESTANFQSWWKTVAAEFADNEKVVFDTNNEYHDMEQSLVLELNQAAINGIRAAGATSQYIFVEGNAYSGAWSWTNTNDNLSGLTDTEDKIVYEMHQYLDSDSSGTSETCVSSTIGQERLQSATAWLKKNGKKGVIGEFAGGVNADCEAAVEGMLSYMSDNTDVWMGASWWSAGPWWGSYMYSLEPSSGPAYSTYLPILEKYFVGDSSSASTSASTSTASAVETSTSTTSTIDAVTTATPDSQVQVSSTVESATLSVAPVETSAPATSVVPTSVPTTMVSVQSPSPVVSAAPTSSVSAVPSGSVAQHYYQCGGINWTGATSCESPYTCVKQNPYYYQCV
ncbi:uncharacterized protein N7477_008560 [Penicillium maclennaniae]|uniref:uncharacterized protein n=1 Tax=Penicillium maclennaniae TaxID=1343394 RepID=UPI002541FDF4|nr:uncharacterized protein N7477_008560 [Penicillium maclennaniae]KAJ5666112.1 hypothetical protein N7477_008560 [Penicillium maclennaniae]